MKAGDRPDRLNLLGFESLPDFLSPSPSIQTHPPNLRILLGVNFEGGERGVSGLSPQGVARRLGPVAAFL